MKKVSLLRKLSLILVMFSTVILIGGCSPEYLQQQGIGSYNYGDYLYSAGHFKLVLEQQPDNPNAYYWLGKNYAVVGDYDTAIVNYKKAIELGGLVTNSKTTPSSYYLDFGKAYFDLANAYYGKGEYQEAAKTLKKLNEVSPGMCIANDTNLFQCTVIYDYANQAKDAIDLHNRYTYAEINLSRKNRILAYFYLRDHNYDTAINLAVKAIEQMPNNELAYYFLGVISGEKGQYDKAVDTIRKAIQIKSNDISPKKYLPMYISLAYYLAQNGQYDAALAAYNDAIQNTKNTTYSIPYNKLIWNTSTSSYVNQIRYKTGYVSYDDYPSIMATAWASYNAGNYTEALKLINDYIDKADNGRVGMVIRDSAYLKSSFDYYHYVFSVRPDSPAEKAGLQFGDRIVAIDGKKAKGKSSNDMVNEISGPVGTEVTLKIERYNNPVKKADKVILEKKLVRENTRDKDVLARLAKIYGVRSLIYRAQGESEKAHSDAQMAIKYNPESFNAKLAWGLANNDKGNYNEAIKILASAKLPENERLYGFDVYYLFTPFPSDEELIKLGKATAYLKLGKANEAVSYLPTKEISSTAGPIWKEYQVLSLELTKLAQTHNEKAVKLEQEGFLKEALNEYTLAFSYANDEKQEEEIRNNILTLLQEYPASLSLPEEARRHMVRADVLVKQNDLNGALNECKRALKLAPYIPKLYYNIAGLNSGLKNYDKAVECMNIYIKLAPDAPDIQNAKDEITKWELLQERK